MADRRIGNEEHRCEYRCDPLPAREALELLGDLMRVVTSGADKLQDVLIAMGAKEKGIEGADEAVKILLIEAVGRVLQVNTSKSLIDLLQRVVATVACKRPSGAYIPVDLNEEFSGRLADAIPVASFALEVQFSDFFGASAASGTLNSLRAAFDMMKFAK